MTNSEKDLLAGEYGLNLPDTVSDEQARYIKTNRDIQKIFDFVGGKNEALRN